MNPTPGIGDGRVSAPAAARLHLACSSESCHFQLKVSFRNILQKLGGNGSLLNDEDRNAILKIVDKNAYYQKK